MIITIDGPAGAGKSSVARELAGRLGFRFLDTGAMYRAVALAASRQGLDWDDEAGIAALAGRLSIVVRDDRVSLDSEDVSEAIRTPEVTAATRHAADNPKVREYLVGLQRRAVADGDFVSEGRDQGTVVFPGAACKIFLTASPEERARRRLMELTAKGQTATLEEVLDAQDRRDAQDAARPVGALRPARDAVEVNTDGLSRDAVVARLERIARACEEFPRA